MRSLEEHKQRLSLTLLFTGLVFVFLLITMVFVGLIIVLLVHMDLLRTGNGAMRTGTFIFIIGLASIVIGTVLSATVGRYPLRPLNAIINAMNRLADGDYQARLEYRGKLGRLPVVREVADSFNKMAAELENTELLRSDFINNFSHEFKTPIVSIAGFAKLLRKGDLSAQEQEEYLGIIEAEALRLSAMATNVLNLSRVETQTILTDVTEYNLSEQLRNCVLLLENKWSPKHLELLLDFHEQTIAANEELMKQVWVNLLDNAVKFTPDYGVIEITVADDAEHTSVSVINSGSEIPDASLGRIFQKFYQADESHSGEGNGIGLAVVQKIIELHGGDVSVESAEGKTTFTVTLPHAEVKLP